MRHSIFNIARPVYMFGHLLLFLMIAFPMVSELLRIKAMLFAVLLFFVSIGFLRSSRLRLHKHIVVGALIFSVTGLFFSVIGSVDFSEGAKKQVQLYVMWPLIYVLIATCILRVRDLIALNNTITYASIFIGVYGLGFIMTKLGLMPDTKLFEIFTSEQQAVTVAEGYIESRFPGINSLSYTMPFAIGSLFTNSKENGASSGSSLVIWLAILFNIILILISGRRALLLVAFLSPLYVTLMCLFLPRHEIKQTFKQIMLSMSGIIVLMLCIYSFLKLEYSIDFQAIWKMVSEGFAFSDSETTSAYSRYLQFNALIDGWSENLVLGAGHGASVSYIRSDTMPWSYELYYLALLYQTGILGFCSYLIGIVWVYWGCIKIIRQGGILSHITLPLLAGMTGTLIASASNPYLLRFDGLWVVFLPISIINYWLINKSRII